MSDELVQALALAVTESEPFASLERIREQAEHLARTGAYQLLPNGKVRPDTSNMVACLRASKLNHKVAKRIAAAAFPEGNGLAAVAERLRAQGINPSTMSPVWDQEAYAEQQERLRNGGKLTDEEIARILP